MPTVLIEMTQDEHAAPKKAGERLGSFGIVGVTDAGGIGEVYRALDTTLKREVALKVLPKL